MSKDLEELSNYFQTVLKDKKAENATLKQQLAIAVEALEKYADKKQWQDEMAMPIIYCEDTGYGDAQAALQKIKELANAKR